MIFPLNLLTHRQRIVFGSIFIFSILLLVYSYLRPTPPPPLSSLTELVPGETKKSQLSNIPSYHATDSGSTQVVYFGQNAPKKYSEAIIQDNVVVAYKKTNPQDFEFNALSKYKNKYSQYAYTINTSYSEFGFVGYVFDVPGLIVVAHPGSEEVIEEWIIPPKSEYVFIETLFPKPEENEGH